MKGTAKRSFLWIALFFSLIVLLTLSAHAAEYTFDGREDFSSSAEEEWKELYDTLPDEIQKELNGVSLDTPTEAVESVSEKLDVSYWINRLLSALKESFLPSLGTASVLFGMLILTSSINLLSKNLTSSSLGAMFELCADVCIAASVFSVAENLIQTASSYLERLCSIMNVMIPVTEAIYLTEASVSQLAVHRSAMLLYLAVTSNLNNLVLKPLFGVLFGFVAVSSVFGQLTLSGFIDGLRKFMMTVISLFTMLFSFILGLQTVLAKSADSLGLKTIRLALGSFIPIIGGTLSEALTVLREGVHVIRGIAGISGVVIILLLVLPVTSSMLCSNLILTFCHMSANILGCEKSARLIGEVKSVLSILCALVYAASLLFVMAMILFAKVGNGG